jgi:hypothetical protein
LNTVRHENRRKTGVYTTKPFSAARRTRIVRRNRPQKRFGLRGGDNAFRLDCLYADNRLVRRFAFRKLALGIVGGIIFGSLIGFVQFFRMTAQIFKNKD